MKITVKLFSSLMEFLPSTANGNSVEIKSQPGASCDSLLAQLQVPADAVRVVMVNGEYVAPEHRADSLSDGDTISVWPAIQGG